MKTYQVDISSLHRRAYAMGEIMDALLLSTMVPSSLVALGGIFFVAGRHSDSVWSSFLGGSNLSYAIRRKIFGREISRAFRALTSGGIGARV